MDKPTTTYHCHSLWSDGGASIERMVAAAAHAGMTEIGVSDHLVLMPDGGSVVWSMPVHRVREYAAEVRHIAASAPIQVKLGVEIDFFPSNPRQAEIDRIVADCGFDYAIGSIHFIDFFSVDSYASDWERLSADDVNEMHRRYWERVALAARSGQFDFLGHIDLPKKFCFLPTIDLTATVLGALDAIATAGVPIELNTAGWDKPCAEQYPSLTLLRECRKRNIPVLINDDAHAEEGVGRHYDKASDTLDQAGYSRLWAPPFAACLPRE